MEVNSPHRAADAQAMAAVFDSVASQVAAGTLTGTLAIVEAVKSGNTKALGANLTAWKSVSDQLATRLGVLYSAGKLKTTQDFATLLSEISLGLKAVK